MSIDTSRPWPRPTPQQVWEAIEAYLDTAYGGEPPSAVRARLETLRSMPIEEFYECSVFEHDVVAYPPRYRLRLGNRFYPHMKLVIDRAPDGHGHLFRADTHDEHCSPEPGSRDFAELMDLMNRNRKLAHEIEQHWEQLAIPTFHSFLRADLARRTAAAAAAAGGKSADRSSSAPGSSGGSKPASAGGARPASGGVKPAASGDGRSGTARVSSRRTPDKTTSKNKNAKQRRQ